MSLSDAIDDRTVQEQIEDLNVEIVRTGRPKTAGLSHGRYELVKVNDGWMGVPMK